MQTELIRGLHRTAHLLAAGGIIACDEGPGTIMQRLEAAGLPQTREYADLWREIVFSHPQLPESLTGVIVHSDTLFHEGHRGLLQKAGMLVIVKADGGMQDTSVGPVMSIPHNIEGQLQGWRGMGAIGTKFRSFIPFDYTEGCLDANVAAQVRLALLSQAAGLVPMVEPEVKLNVDATIDEVYARTREVLKRHFEALLAAGVDINGMILKPNMVLSGYKCDKQADDDQVTELTIRCLLDSVPANLPGVAFLSGGQTGEQYNRRLKAMNNRARGGGIFVPFQLTCSAGRSLQDAGRKALATDGPEAASSQLEWDLLEVYSARFALAA